MKIYYQLNEKGINKIKNLFDNNTSEEIIKQINKKFIEYDKEKIDSIDDIKLLLEINNNQITVHDLVNTSGNFVFKFNKCELKECIVKLNHEEIKPGIWYRCGEIEWKDVYKHLKCVNIIFNNGDISKVNNYNQQFITDEILYVGFLKYEFKQYVLDVSFHINFDLYDEKYKHFCVMFIPYQK